MEQQAWKHGRSWNKGSDEDDAPGCCRADPPEIGLFAFCNRTRLLESNNLYTSTVASRTYRPGFPFTGSQAHRLTALPWTTRTQWRMADGGWRLAA